MGFRVCGFDVSPTHGGAVALDASGQLLDFTFLAEKAKDATTKAAREHGVAFPHLMPKAIPEREDRDMRRLVPTMRLFLQWRKRLACPAPGETYGAIEAYAFGGGSVGAHTKGEIGGLLRMTLMAGAWNLRTHDPTSVKLFATGQGDADKHDVAAGIERKWGPLVVQALYAYGDKVGEDLADAYVLARMALREVQLRAGEVALRDLPEEERRVFNRCTKPQPVNVLGRNWHREA